MKYLLYGTAGPAERILLEFLTYLNSKRLHKMYLKLYYLKYFSLLDFGRLKP